jgi:hypothetical protein
MSLSLYANPLSSGVDDDAHLVEPVLSSIRNIHNLDHLGQQPRIKQITSTQIRLQLCTSGKNQSSYIDFIGRDEMLDGEFGDFTNVVTSCFFS